MALLLVLHPPVLHWWCQLPDLEQPLGLSWLSLTQVHKQGWQRLKLLVQYQQQYKEQVPVHHLLPQGMALLYLGHTRV
jgi:hypothetical protein